jgi:DNA-binding transcriptional MocR family regulator
VAVASRNITLHELTRLLGDWRNGTGPLYERLARRLAQLLADGRVTPGTRLPSERSLAAKLELSRTTIIRAYAHLREQGLLESRRGAGSVTRLDPASVAEHVPWAHAARLEDAVPRLLDLTKALPPTDGRLASALQRAGVEAGALLGHHGYYPLGLTRLREAVAARYEQRGVPTAPEQILITAGAQNAIDLVVRTFIRSRETVIVESPTYPGAMDSLRLAGARLISLDISQGPWDLEMLEGLIAQTGARMVFVIPDFQNPTGRLMSDEQRAQLVATCHARGVLLVADETLVELGLDEAERPQPVAAYDPAHEVLSVGSLSKALWAGLRVGWVRASPRQIAALVATRSAADLGGAPIEQLAACALLPELDEILTGRRAGLLAQRDEIVGAVRDLGWRVEAPTGGLSTWVELPDASSSQLADVAWRHGLMLIPGPRLSPDGVLDRFLRLPYGAPVATLRTAAGRLHDAWSEMQSAATPAPLLQVV